MKGEGQIDLPPSLPGKTAFKKPSLIRVKVQVFFGKNIEKKHFCRHDKNYYYFCKSKISVINLIAGYRNMIKVSKNMSS